MTLRAAALLLALALPMTPPAPDAHRDDLDAWVGGYAMELRVASTMRLPLLPPQRSVTTSLLLVELERGPAGLIQRHRVCEVRMESGSPAMRTLVPSAFVQALPARHYRAVLLPERTRDGEGGPSLWRYRVDLGPEAIGFDPQLTGGELPRGGDDAGVRDSDGDGDPGATIELRVPAFGRVRLFIAQYSHLVLEGRQTGPGRIEGEVEILRLEQRTLGAEPGLFNRTPTLRPESTRSGFTLVRLPAGLDCAALRSAAPALFP